MKIVAAFVVYPQLESEINARILIESFRRFGGSFADLPLCCLVPDIGKDLSKSLLELIERANVQKVMCKVRREVLSFPLALDVTAAAQAEANASAAELLIWLGVNTIIYNEPGSFALTGKTQIGYRPVHHQNIGSLFNEGIDAFWDAIYRLCRVPPERVFPMMTHTDGKKIRPYFNAGSLAVRPERGLLKTWHDLFFSSYQNPEFINFYNADKRYEIFMHQAVLTGVILNMFRPDELKQMPSTYNYPLHLWNQDVTACRPRAMSQIITARHEGFYRDQDWRNKMPDGDDLKEWLAQFSTLWN